MSSVNSRFKGFGFGKRKSATSFQSSPDSQHASQTPPSSGHQHLPVPGQTPPLGPSASSTSLPMNHPGAASRPPGYSPGYQQGPPPGAAPPGAPIGRSSPHGQGQNRTPPSQMAGGPPPINTAPSGYPPPHGMAHPGGHAPMAGAPPSGPPGFGGQGGYPPGAPPPAGGPIAQQYRNPTAEVEGVSKGRSQLIVGIDFVRWLRSALLRSAALAPAC